ncbi:MAG: polysaccharide deacetylase family protein [Acidobacteriaceae bacterium]
MAAFLLWLLVAFGAAQQREVAITIDDLPVAQTAEGTQQQKYEELLAINKGMLETARKHHAPLIGFVNAKKIEQSASPEGVMQVLAAWTKDGNTLGNHTYSHADLNKLTLEQVEEEIAKGETPVDKLMSEAGIKAEYFRHPFLRTGATPQQQERINEVLKCLGLKIATVTMDDDDWQFNPVYEEMLTKHDEAGAQRVRDAYLAHAKAKITGQAEIARQVFGRDIPHTMLMHADRLNMDMLDAVLKEFERQDYKFVTIAEAQSDAAYRSLEGFLQDGGGTWTFRWAKGLGKKVDWKLDPEPPEWIRNWGK